MKLTIEIDTASHRLERCIATSRRILDMLETLVDRAPGHPELPLVPQPVSGLSPEVAKAIQDATNDYALPVWNGIDQPGSVMPVASDTILRSVQTGKTMTLKEWAEAMLEHGPSTIQGPVRAAIDAVKALDWPALPEGIPAPPEGFAFASVGPLKVSSPAKTSDIITYYMCEWNDNEGNGWHGATEGPWAVRIGSDIAKANGII